MNALDLLKERGFVKQITFEDELYEAFDKGMVSFYVGFGSWPWRTCRRRATSPSR